VTDPDIVPPDKPPEVKFRYEATSQLRKKLSVSGGASSPPPKDTGRAGHKASKLLRSRGAFRLSIGRHDGGNCGFRVLNHAWM
jgi:hypothetical protein